MGLLRMGFKRSKWMKIPRRIEEAWDDVRAKVTHDSRKREFKRALREGKRSTTDPEKNRKQGVQHKTPKYVRKQCRS